MNNALHAAENQVPEAGVRNPRLALFQATLRRLWPLLLAGLLCGGLLGAMAGMRTPEERTASALILINPLEGNAYYPSTRGEQLVNLATESQVLRSNDVAKAVAKNVAPGVGVDELLAAVSVTNPVNTQILEIDYADKNPDVALKRAQGFADAFLNYRRNRAAGSVDSQVKVMQTELAKYDTELKALTSQLAKTPAGSAEGDLLSVQVQSIGSRISQLNAHMSDVSSTSLDAGQVITPAKLAKGSMFGPGDMMIVAGALLGLLLAAGYAFFRSRPNGMVRSLSDIRALGLDPLAAIRRPSTSRSFRETNPAEASDGKIQQFRAQLLTLLRHRGTKTVLLTAPRPSVAAPSSVVPLAQSMASSHLSTIVLDTTGTLLPADDGKHPGLSELLHDKATLEQALTPIGRGLQVICAGADLEDGAGLFVGPRMRELLVRLGERADVVLVAAGSLQLPEAQSLAASVRTVVVEVDCDGSRYSDLQEALRACDGVAADLLGAVVVEQAQKTAPGRKPTMRTVHAKNGHGLSGEPAAATAEASPSIFRGTHGG